MVREFQKHTDGLPIPRSDIDVKQVDSCVVSFAALARACARYVDCFLSHEYRRIPSFTTAKMPLTLYTWRETQFASKRELRGKNISLNSVSKKKKK